MKILYLTMDGFDTPGPNNQMAMVMLNDFLKNEYHVHLIESHRVGKFNDIPDILQGKENLRYDIIPRKVIDKTNFVVRYLDEVKYAFSSMKRWLQVKDVDIIFLQSCPTVIVQLLLLKLFKRKPIIYNIYDVFPGHAYDIGVIKSKFIYHVLKIIQKPTYKLASIVAVLSQDMKDIVVKQGAREDKVRIVPAWYDDKNVKEIPWGDNKFVQKFNIPHDKFYVQFAGTVGYVFNYKTIIEIAQKVQSNANIEFQIVGDGNAKKAFMQEVAQKKLDNIKFYPLQPIDIVPDVYSTCSLCIIPLMRGVIGNGVPSKAPLLMACNRPILSAVESNSDYFKMFVENCIGMVADVDDYDELAQKIIFAYQNPKEIRKITSNAKKFAQDNFTSTMNTRKFMDIFEELGGTHENTHPRVHQN